MANLQKIRKLCDEKNLMIKDLAKQLNLSEGGLQKIIRTNTTTLETLQRIANILKVNVSVFFDDDEKNNPIIKLTHNGTGHNVGFGKVNDIFGKQVEGMIAQIERQNAQIAAYEKEILLLKEQIEELKRDKEFLRKLVDK